MEFLRKIRKPFPYSFYNASFIIIGVNVLVFVLTYLYPKLLSYLSLNVVYVVRYHMYWQPLTYMFVHGSFSHILFNMLGIFFFGVAVERAIGSKEFLLLYFCSGILCGVISFAIYYATGTFVFLMGASGAIYALLLTYAVIFPRSRIFIWGILPIPAPLLIAIYAGIEIASQLFSLRDGVAHMAHLTGFAVAWLYLMIRMGINPWKVWKNAYRS
ncbi:rhomboid family intramembrane serine protease [Treponema brennaborense]|uniref:Rhomboid family protein n=1 Tax=Treponema brennaborense (strain DSM 12168 / CIP 105900 / DD5/3) TaxID=906968 RepID=F4LM73_TREBD|nr:rhomboid family intramembrane serine protease [Treponema brennaborense]AEE17739.1 Rhomboid family protein [Treponema brennaborense DSM 12168]